MVSAINCVSCLPFAVIYYDFFKAATFNCRCISLLVDAHTHTHIQPSLTENRSRLENITQGLALIYSLWMHTLVILLKGFCLQHKTTSFPIQNLFFLGTDAFAESQHWHKTDKRFELISSCKMVKIVANSFLFGFTRAEIAWIYLLGYDWPAEMGKFESTFLSLQWEEAISSEPCQGQCYS